MKEHFPHIQDSKNPRRAQVSKVTCGGCRGGVPGLPGGMDSQGIRQVAQVDDDARYLVAITIVNVAVAPSGLSSHYFLSF